MTTNRRRRIKRRHRENRQRQRVAHAERLRWRTAPATPRQVAALRRIASENGHTFSVGITQGDAWRRDRSRRQPGPGPLADRLRAALVHAAEELTVRTSTFRAVEQLVDVDADYMIEFTVREDVLVDFAGMYPNVRRVPLALGQEKDRKGSPLRYLFGPIPVGD